MLWKPKKHPRATYLHVVGVGLQCLSLQVPNARGLDCNFYSHNCICHNFAQSVSLHLHHFCTVLQSFAKMAHEKEKKRKREKEKAEETTAKRGLLRPQMLGSQSHKWQSIPPQKTFRVAESSQQMCYR